MNLPNVEMADVPEAKITRYLLNEEKSGGKDRFFTSFGFSTTEWELLKLALIQHAESHEVNEIVNTQFGTKYIIEGVLNAPDGRHPQVRVVWQIDHEQTVPHLVTVSTVEEERMTIPEFERAVLVESFSDAGYEAGDIGIVVYIHSGGAGYELEMMTADGHTRGVLTVEAHQVRPVTRQDMLHVRVVESGESLQSA